MSLFRLSNYIFELGLDAQELSVYAYLCSLPTDRAKPADRVMNGQPVQENDYFFFDFLAGT